jgi:hypothetical protein
MLVSGELENVPLLEVLQVVSHSRQTGVLTVEGDLAKGTIVFSRGGVVCAESSSTRLLLARAGTATEPRTRRSFRRACALAALTELVHLKKGVFRFRRVDAPLLELEGVVTGPFYEAGPMDTGELLLALATTIDRLEMPKEELRTADSSRQRASVRYGPTLVPAVIESGPSRLEGHLTNLSDGGAFFHGDVLPANGKSCRILFTLPGELGQIRALVRVAWVRPEGLPGQRGAGLAFEKIPDDEHARLTKYLEQYRELADRVGAD